MFTRTHGAHAHPQVEQKYLANIYVDDLPVYGPVGNLVEKELCIYVNQK